MKLLTKINRSYFKYGLLVFLIADAIIILISNTLLKSEIDQELQLEVKEIIQTIKEKGSFQNINPTSIVQFTQSGEVGKYQTKDTMVYDSFQDELAPFREYTTIASINGQKYKITTRHMLMEFYDIFTLYTTLISTVLLLIFLGFLFFTQKLNAMLWNTFNQNVDRLKSYSFNSPAKLDLAPTGINEFDELNQVLAKMSKRLEKDYLASKEFAANAAHELQTPLAVIRNKCENMFSSTSLPKETIETIREIYLSTDRLSGTTKALLLLAKIDHGQFNENQMVSFNQVITTWINTFQEILDEYNIHISLSEQNECKALMDIRLANLLVQNILTNAIQNSPHSNVIQINLSDKKISISNSGDEAIKNPEKIFNRFYKESQQNASSGIGLAIVKKIADHYQLSIEYAFADFKHTFTFHLNNC